MKSLPTLIKLANQRVNNQRLRVADYEKRQQEFEQQMHILRENLKFEAERARKDPMLNVHYGRYAQQVEEQIEQIRVKNEENKKRLVREQDRLATLFKEQKVLEVYEDQQKEKILKDQNDKQQKNLDELAARLKNKKA